MASNGSDPVAPGDAAPSSDDAGRSGGDQARRSSSGGAADRDPARPVIGLTTYLEQAKQGVWDVRAAFLPQQYLDSITASGGVVVLLPPQPGPDAAAEAVLDGLDGLVFTGGLDVQPELYGAPRHPLTDAPRADRDAWELSLFQGAQRRGIPVLAICRGLQLVNVARGGTLHQHLPEALGTERFRIGGGVFAANEVQVDDGTRLSELVGAGTLSVHSYHHQGIDRLGEGLVVTARTDDGLPQAVEDADGSYLVGVQWHPEQNVEDRRLFAGLVAAAANYRASPPVGHRASASTESRRPDRDRTVAS